MPRVTLAGGDLAALDGLAALAVGLAPPAAGETLVQSRPGAADDALAFAIDLATVCEQEGFTAQAGAVLQVAAGPGPGARVPPGLRLLGIGLGDGSATAARRAGAALARAVRGRAQVGTRVAAGLAPPARRAFVEGYLLGAYRPPRAGVSDGPAPSADLVLLGPPAQPGTAAELGTAVQTDVQRARVAAAATWQVRDLANTPSSTKTPSWVADQIRSLAQGVPGLTTQVLDQQALADGGFGGTLAVGQGSVHPACLVRLSWEPPAADRPAEHVVLVGKGVTYDTGGLSVKPREAMVPMKTDMAGAAVALATVLACAAEGVPRRVTALAPLTENAVGAASYRPGDVVRVWGGTTVEVADTDAEGRMVLADALAYADATLDPDVLVDVATLTGAATLGLGRRHAALFTADDQLAAQLETAALETGERVWRMPLVAEYRTCLDSAVADVRHVPDVSPGGGAITAALFLQGFTGSRRWVHLDVAGPARADQDEHEVSRGATGFGARLLLSWLRDRP